MLLPAQECQIADLGIQSSSIDSCLQQPRQDAANLITCLLVGATGCRHRGPQAAKMTASSNNSARPSSSRQPGNLGSKATAQAALGGSCLQQPRQDAANLVTYLLLRGHSRLPQPATGAHTMHNFLAQQPPWTPPKCTPARTGSSNSSIWAAGAPLPPQRHHKPSHDSPKASK